MDRPHRGTWFEGLEMGRKGREPDLDASIKVNRHKPGPLALMPPRPNQTDTISFALPGTNSKMAEISGDPRLSDMTVATVAANKIKEAWLSHRARLTVGSDKTMAEDHLSTFKKAADKRFDDEVTQRRLKVAKQATATSNELMAGSENMSRLYKRTHPEGSGDLKEIIATKFEDTHTKNWKQPQKDFIARMESMTKDMRASMYFSGKDQEKMFSSGALFAKHTRRVLDMGDESHTTETDDRRLGNHDHVFFFLEHRDSPMREGTRFTQQSTESGAVAQKDAEEDAGERRRISFPLANLMQEGTWAMKQDFLSPEARLGKVLPVHENFVATPKRDPHEAATHFMRQLAISALDMPAFKNKGKPRSQEIQSYLDLGNREFVENVFHRVLRPQLMVPSVVNLNTRGAVLDVPKPQTHLNPQSSGGEIDEK